MTRTTSIQLDDTCESVRLLPLKDAITVMGIKPQLAADWLWKCKFPIQTIKINGTRFVRLSHLHEFIERQFQVQNCFENGVSNG
jgi:hypothetical protein